jgi:hypothetical protein
MIVGRVAPNAPYLIFSAFSSGLRCLPGREPRCMPRSSSRGTRLGVPTGYGRPTTPTSRSNCAGSGFRASLAEAVAEAITTGLRESTMALALDG